VSEKARQVGWKDADIESDYDENRKIIGQLMVAFRIGICLLTPEIVFLLWNLLG
jgi:hypothetical protein